MTRLHIGAGSAQSPLLCRKQAISPSPCKLAHIVLTSGRLLPQYITLLRKAKLRERLKAARRAMQELFPLTEQLWVEWLDDEAPSTPCAEMIKLFELAVGDYLSIPIWRKYLE